MSAFEKKWKPEKWMCHFRFVVIRQEKPQQQKGELQLDLFEPRDWTYEYKVIVTNKVVGTRAVVRYHEGRGSQEGIFGELLGVEVGAYTGDTSAILSKDLMVHAAPDFVWYLETPL